VVGGESADCTTGEIKKLWQTQEKTANSTSSGRTRGVEFVVGGLELLNPQHASVNGRARVGDATM
jgi:hypothetical protein